VSSDPFEVLGLASTATRAEIHAARRRLAKSLHPDIGGDAVTMQSVNAAATEALAQRTRVDAAPTRTGTSTERPARREKGESHRVIDDRPSFTIEALPVEAFEALILVTSWIGEVLVDDPPYALEVQLGEPLWCWCGLELMPEAGSTSVGITVARIPGHRRPEIDEVRDLWIRCLNELDWHQLDGNGPG
jgi:hypothetical protein